MERLAFDLESAGPPAPRAPPVVVGVVASGNLEVLVEPADLPGRCRVEVSTSANGFGPVDGSINAGLDGSGKIGPPS